MIDWTTESRTFRTFLLVAQLDPDGIRARIRQARKEAGLTQEQLAELIEKHKRTVENYERVRVPDYRELNKIARVLNRPIEWFLHGDVPADDALAEVSAKLDDLRQAVDGIDRKLDELDVQGRFAAVEELLRELRAEVAAEG